MSSKAHKSKRIQLAVRDFALPIPRRGSIETHSGYDLLPDSGNEAHRAAQKKRAAANAQYKTEVKLSRSFERGDYKFMVSGRVDGLITRDVPHIEEIKTTVDAHELIEKLMVSPWHPYCLQLQTYAYFYSLQYNVFPTISFHVVSILSGESYDLPILFNQETYVDWLEKRLDELVRDAEETERERARREKLAEALKFPFEQYRPGQKDLIEAIEKAQATSDLLMIQAPTGLGKTAGVILPTLKDALSRGQKLIYVTPRNSQHQAAADAIAGIRKEGCAVRALTLTAKAKICFKGEPVCNPDSCEFAKDFYEKLYREDVVGKAADSPTMDAQLFSELGKKYEVCPFELSLESIRYADAVIGDYNYVFAPRSVIGRFSPTSMEGTEKPNLVIDEAHNLPVRAAEYYSPSLCAEAVAACKRHAKSLSSELRREATAVLRECTSEIDKLAPSGTATQVRVDLNPDCFNAVDERLGRLLNKYLQKQGVLKPGDPVINLCRQWSEFAGVCGQEGDHFFAVASGRGSAATLKITCCDASDQIRACVKEFEHVVAFSATLKPFDYYRRLFGFEDGGMQSLELPSPFPGTNRKLLVIPQVSTRYRDRAKNYAKIASAIERIVNLRRGNYFVFFPSFVFLQHVFELTSVPGFQLLKQEAGMGMSDVRRFLDTLRSGEEPTVIFAVQGGIFSEGVDYPGDMLIGALIVGPALPGFDLERELMREYFEKKFGEGFDYAYTYPAMAKAIQAAGRVIRSETDRGLIVLMDRRFTQPAYTATMPGDWYTDSIGELVSNRILGDIQQFWQEGDVL